MKKEEVKEKVREIRLIALDMDGTSMNSRSEVTPHTSQVIQSLVDRGYMVVPATGRGFQGLREHFLRVEGIRYVISANGAVVTDGETGQRMRERLIPCETAVRLAKDFLKGNICLYIHRNDGKSTHLFACGDREAYVRDFQRNGWPPLESVMGKEFVDFIREDGKDVIKFGLRFADDQAFWDGKTLVEENYPELSVFQVADCGLEVTHCEANKGIALSYLCGQLQIPPSQVCAIGDNGNDVSMIRYAGLGVAMGNGIEEAKDSADYVAGLNDEDGAAAFFEEFFLGKSC